MFFVKATDEKMRGHGKFQFELNKVYKHDSDLIHCCKSGFHCCDALDHIRMSSPYCPDGHTRYFIVKAWGHSDVQIGQNGATSYRKYAFQYMQFIKELKYKTLADVNQSIVHIYELFRGRKRDNNLQQFDQFQAQFPSILKKGISDVGYGKTAPSLSKCRTYAETYAGGPHEPYLWTLGEVHLIELFKKKFDVYHMDSEPALGLCFEDARVHVQLFATEK